MTANTAIKQGKRITAVVSDVGAGLNCSFEVALDLVAGVLIGLEESIVRLGVEGEYVVLDDADEVEIRLRAMEAKYGDMAADRLRARGLIR